MFISLTLLYKVQYISYQYLRYYHHCYLKKYVTSDRNEVAAADNPTNNDTYEYIEGATINQIKKGKNYIIHLPLCNTCR